MAPTIAPYGSWRSTITIEALLVDRIIASEPRTRRRDDRLARGPPIRAGPLGRRPGDRGRRCRGADAGGLGRPRRRPRVRRWCLGDPRRRRLLLRTVGRSALSHRGRTRPRPVAPVRPSRRQAPCATPISTPILRRSRLLAVREDHRPAARPSNEIVAIPLGADVTEPADPIVLVSGVGLLRPARPQPRRRAPGLADLATAGHALGRLRAVGRRPRRRGSARRGAAGRRQSERVDRRASLVA